MFSLHFMQFGDHILLSPFSKGITGNSFPQSVLIGKGEQYLIAVHQVGHNIRMVYGYGIGTEIKALSQFLYGGTSHLGTLLRGISSTFCKKIE